MSRAAAVVSVAGVLLVACVDRGQGPQGKKIEPAYIRENLLAAEPSDLRRLDVDLGGKVVYLGNRLAYVDGKDPATPLPPGQSIRVYHYWRVVQPPGPRWRVFALVRGVAGTADFMNLGATDMQIGHPVTKWKAGQIIQDVQDIVLRPDWRSPTATVSIGLVEAGGNQLGDRLAASGPHVVDRAVIARTIEVDLSKAPPPPGTVHVPRAQGPINIDGIPGDPGWANAAVSTDFATADGSPEPVGRAIARMTWDDEHLYVLVSITDTDVVSPFTQQDDPLWKADCVELFIDADGNRRGYVELQVNPHNATFDSFFAGTRAQPGDEAWDAPLVTAVKLRGTPNKGDSDQGWDVEIAIPHAAVKGTDAAMNVVVPPRVGDRWRLNVVRVDTRSSGGNPSASSWNRITYSDFHALDRMLVVVFADATGAIAATPVEQAGAGSAAPAPGTAGSGGAPGPGSGGAIGSGAAPSSAGSGAAAPGAGAAMLPQVAPAVVQPASPGPPPGPQPARPAPAPKAAPAPDVDVLRRHPDDDLPVGVEQPPTGSARTP